MNPHQTMGYWKHQSDDRCEYLALSFSPVSAPLRSRWRNNGISADFLGDYVRTFLPTPGDSAGCNQSEIQHAVTYIANEFLENAMKYHKRDADIPIGIRVELTNDSIMVSTSNGIGSTQAERYKAFVEHILNDDPGDLLIRHLEGGSSSQEPNSSCLGLLTMINDYGVQLGWRFDRHAEDIDVLTVTTSAVLPLRNLEGVTA